MFGWGSFLGVVATTLNTVHGTMYCVQIVLPLFTEIRYRRDGSEIFRVQQSGTDKRLEERASYLERQGKSSPSNHNKCVFIIRYTIYHVKFFQCNLVTYTVLCAISTSYLLVS